MHETVIVIGATGLIGSELVSCLAQTEGVERVVTLTRRPVEHASTKIQNHVVDFDRLTDSAHLFKGEVLFSCLGTTVKQAGSIEAQRIVDLDYQYAAAKLAAEQGVSHYILVSSSGANTKSLSPYLRMKGELEERVKSLVFKHISIVQPSLLLGERADNRRAESFAASVLPTLCKLPGLRRYRPIYGAEVAQRLVELSLGTAEGVQTLSLDEVFPLG